MEKAVQYVVEGVDLSDRYVEFNYEGDWKDPEAHWKDKMGIYEKTVQMNQGFPVFEQIDKKEGAESYYLYVGLDGRWRVGTSLVDQDTHSSVLKHPRSDPTPEIPPYKGWYRRENEAVYDNDYGWTWVEEDSIKAVVKQECKAEPVTPSVFPRLPYCTVTLDTKFLMTTAAFAEDGQIIYTGAGPYVDIWDLKQAPTNVSRCSRVYSTPSCQINMEGGIPGQLDKDYISVLSLSLQGNSLLVGGEFKGKEMTKPIQVIDLGGSCPTFKSEMGDFKKTCLQLIMSKDGRHCYSIYDQAREIDIWDVSNGVRVGKLEGHTADITKIEASCEGDHLWSKGEDNTVRLWDLRNFGQLNRYEITGGMTCSPNEDSVFAISGEHEISVFHAKKPEVEKYEVVSGVDMLGYTRMQLANSGKWMFMTRNDGQHAYSAPSSAAPCSWLFTIDQLYTRREYNGPWTISNDDKYMLLGKVNNSGGNMRYYAEVYQIDY